MSVKRPTCGIDNPTEERVADGEQLGPVDRTSSRRCWGAEPRRGGWVSKATTRAPGDSPNTSSDGMR